MSLRIEEVGADHPSFEDCIHLMRTMIPDIKIPFEMSVKNARRLFQSDIGYTILGGFLDNKLVAVLCMRSFFDPLEESHGVEINNFTVISEHRGHGYGKDLIIRAQELARQNYASWSRVIVDIQNQKLEKYYKELSYIPFCYEMFLEFSKDKT